MGIIKRRQKCIDAPSTVTVKYTVLDSIPSPRIPPIHHKVLLTQSFMRYMSICNSFPSDKDRHSVTLFPYSVQVYNRCTSRDTEKHSTGIPPVCMSQPVAVISLATSRQHH